MTPKEKAEELYSGYLSTVRFTMEDCSWSYRGDTWEFCVRRTSKWSALIAVDEMLSHTMNCDYGCAGYPYEFWQQVKNEIELL